MFLKQKFLTLIRVIGKFNIFYYLALIALAITYALSTTNLLNSLLSSFVETEKELVSVERICDYIENIPFEETTRDKEDLDKYLVIRFVKFFYIFSFVTQ